MRSPSPSLAETPVATRAVDVDVVLIYT